MPTPINREKDIGGGGGGAVLPFRTPFLYQSQVDRATIGKIET